MFSVPPHQTARPAVGCAELRSVRLQDARKRRAVQPCRAQLRSQIVQFVDSLVQGGLDLGTWTAGGLWLPSLPSRASCSCNAASTARLVIELICYVAALAFLHGTSRRESARNCSRLASTSSSSRALRLGSLRLVMSG